jgi:hypothetical protein
MAHTISKRTERVLLQALACGATVENAARKAGICERTVYRRLADPVFYRQLQELRTEMVQRTAGMLTGAGMGSVKVLVDLQGDVSVPAGVRRRSARDVLELGLKLRENTTGEQRQSVLEEHLVQAIARRLAQIFPQTGAGQCPDPNPPVAHSASGQQGENRDQATDATPGKPPETLVN